MTSLPPIDASLLPADIRSGSTQRKQSYEAALGFERMLVQQLTKSLADTAQRTDDDTAQDAATTTYRGMLPDTLADGVIAAGGLGLARQLVPEEKTQ
jgi:Rod binding domain-containing protein